MTSRNVPIGSSDWANGIKEEAAIPFHQWLPESHNRYQVISLEAVKRSGNTRIGHCQVTVRRARLALMNARLNGL